jgi:hypothetical protein
MNMKKTLTVLISAGILCSYNISFADIYKYIDAEGVMHLTGDYNSEPCKTYGCKLIQKERIIQKHKVRGADRNKSSTAIRECYKLENGAMIFVSASDINHYMELVYSKGNIATEYFNDLVSRKLAFQTNKELIVYKFDEFYVGGGNFLVCRVKLQDGTVLGWTFEKYSLKKIKAKK